MIVFQKSHPLCAVFPLFLIVFLTDKEAVANTLSHRVLKDEHAMEEETKNSKTGWRTWWRT